MLKKRSRTASAVVKSLTRDPDVIRARIGGASYTEIADTFGISRSQAYRSVAKHLRAMLEECQELSAEILEMEQARLDKLHAAVWPAALEGDLGAVAACLKISERRSKLLGLDAPVRADVGFHGAEELTDAQLVQIASGVPRGSCSSDE